MVVMMLNFWTRVVEEQKEHNEAAGGQGRYTRLAWCTTPSERVIRRPSGEEGASAFRCCLPINKDLRKRVRERVRGSDRTRPNRISNGAARLTTIIIIVRESDRARPNRISNGAAPLPEALKRRQGR